MSREVAPRARKVAMVGSRASAQAPTPPVTPIPPTSSAVSATRVMKRLARSRKRCKPGAAWEASRICQIASGKARARAAFSEARLVPGGSTTRSAWRTSEPGTTRPVAGREARPIRTGGPSRSGLATWSGAERRAARRVKRARPRVTVSPTRRPSRCRTSGAAARPFPARTRAVGRAGAKSGWPASGQAPSTALSETSWRAPEGAMSIACISTTSETRAPRAASQATSAGGTGSSPVPISRSPPRSARPDWARPWARLARRLAMPAIAATPRARQASATQRPRAPERSPRRARRSAGKGGSRLTPPAQERRGVRPRW